LFFGLPPFGHQSHSFPKTLAIVPTRLFNVSFIRFFGSYPKRSCREFFFPAILSVERLRPGIALVLPVIFSLFRTYPRLSRNAVPCALPFVSSLLIFHSQRRFPLAPLMASPLFQSYSHLSLFHEFYPFFPPPFFFA